MFNEAHDFFISNSELRVHNQYGQSGIDILREASSLGATMDSQQNYDRRCFPGTRKQYISDVTNWATASIGIPPPSIYWMKGPAGVGKSAIAQTCAESLRRAGYLGAAFFFSVKKHNNPSHLFTTIAYQLAILLPDYHTLVDDKISKDKSIVKKRISLQFELLIAEPLQELKRQGKGVGTRAVLIDGLDECADKDSQAEIVEVIASSVRAKSTPFRWAIFSREEPHIVSTFASHSISSHCYSVFLPISREADHEVELYLRGGFENILKRRNFLHLSSSWPTAEQIKKLVDAAAGLFAHPAAVLRFIDRHSYSGFKETLEAVLKSIVKPGSQATSPYTELDALYMLILQNVPGDILPPMLLLLADIVQEDFRRTENWRIGIFCNCLGISETVFQSIYHHLQSVICFHPPPPYSLDQIDVDPARSYRDQEPSFRLSHQIKDRFYTIHGAISFYHKSFYDFLVEPTRSSTFCVTTPIVHGKLFDCCVQQHHHYASSYIIQGSKLALVPGTAKYSTSLSWPQGTEFVDSFLHLRAFLNASGHLSHDGLLFGHLLKSLSLDSLRNLAQLDYRKDLIADIMSPEDSDLSDGVIIAGHRGFLRTLPHTRFQCLQPGEFDAFQPEAFFATVEKLEKLEVIRPYHPRLGSGHVVSFLLSSRRSRRKPSGRSYGLYKLGHGNRSVVWYWELDAEKRYFHDFQTVDYAEAMKIYKTEQFKMWEESWVPPY